MCLQANTAVFEACSKERIQPFDDEEEEEEDIWEEKEISFATQTKSRKRSDPQHLIPTITVLFKEFICCNRTWDRIGVFLLTQLHFLVKSNIEFY